MRVVKAALLQTAFFAVAGLLLWLLSARLQAPDAPALGLTAAISILALAWCAGVVVPGSSAGVGVREAALVLALEPYLVSDGAMVVAVALRLVTTLGDLLFFGLCAIAHWHDPSSSVDENADGGGSGRPLRSRSPAAPAAIEARAR